MNKIFIILSLLFCSTAFADDYILTGNAGECDNTVLRSVNNKTYLTPVYTPIEYTCSVGTFLPANTTSCASCPGGYTCSGGTYAFNEKIAQGIVANTDNLGTTKTCSTNLLRVVNMKTYLTPVYTPIEYTCSVGTFLPANTTSCASCPGGYTCSGGTYAFNENIAQGIVANTDNLGTAKTCSTNLLRSVNNKTYLTPIYEPNTININWDNGNNTTTTTTCEYNGLITLPPEPTRPGYTFSGWVLKTN